MGLLFRLLICSDELQEQQRLTETLAKARGYTVDQYIETELQKILNQDSIQEVTMNEEVLKKAKKLIVEYEDARKHIHDRIGIPDFDDRLRKAERELIYFLGTIQESFVFDNVFYGLDKDIRSLYRCHCNFIRD